MHMLITSCSVACNVSLLRFVRRNIQNQLHVSMTEDVRPGKRFEFNRNLFIVARSKIGVQRNTIVAQNKFASRVSATSATRKQICCALGYLHVLNYYVELHRLKFIIHTELLKLLLHLHELL